MRDNHLVVKAYYDLSSAPVGGWYSRATLVTDLRGECVGSCGERLSKKVRSDPSRWIYVGKYDSRDGPPLGFWDLAKKNGERTVINSVT